MKNADQIRALMPGKNPMLMEELAIEIECEARRNVSNYNYQGQLHPEFQNDLRRLGFKVTQHTGYCSIIW